MAELDKIIPALAAAIGSVHKVAKTGRNTHDGYNFAGIDDFLALVNPICAEHGLFVHIEEAEREDFMRKGKFGENAWMRQAFTFTLYHASGQSMPTVKRTVEVLRNGAQAYGSAQSYALKQFLRGALLIPTGDKDDADLRATDDGVVIAKDKPKKAPDNAPAAVLEQPAKKANPVSEGLRDAWRDGVMDSLPEGATPRQIAEAFADQIIADFAGYKTVKGLNGYWDKQAKITSGLESKHPDLHEKIVDAFMTCEMNLAEQANVLNGFPAG